MSRADNKFFILLSIIFIGSLGGEAVLDEGVDQNQTDSATSGYNTSSDIHVHEETNTVTDTRQHVTEDRQHVTDDTQHETEESMPMLELVFPRRRSFVRVSEKDVKKKRVMPTVSIRKTFMDVVTPKYYGFSPIDHMIDKEKGKPENICTPRNITENSTFEVELVNSTTLLSMLGNKTDELGPCSVVLFFAPWCMFCASIAPYYSALARAFPQLNILAIEAAQFSSLNTRYGTIAVPNMLVFYNNSKSVAKFNHTERTFETFVSFVQNITGFKPNASVQVEDIDLEGPFKDIWTGDSDWLLWLSWIFVISFFFTVFLKSNVGQNLINMVLNFGVEHHQHID